jgi:hypothetical protein
MSSDDIFAGVLPDDLEIDLGQEIEAKISNVFDDMPPLNERAMLSILKRHDTRMTRAYDEDTQEELRKAAGDNSLTANKKLFRDPNSMVRQLIRKSNQLYTYHRERTLESGTTGERVLDLMPKSGEHVIVEFSREINNRIDEITQMLETQIIPNWKQLVQIDIDYRSEVARMEADPVLRQRKLDRICEAEYPDVDDLREQFGVEWDLKPLSDQSAIAKLSRGPAEILEKARNDVAKIIGDVQKAARSDMAERMLDPIRKATKKLSVPVGEKGSVFRDSMIENLKTQLEAITELCVVDDPKLHQAIAEATQLLQSKLPGNEALRTSQQARDQAVQQLNDLATTFNGLRY